MSSLRLTHLVSQLFPTLIFFAALTPSKPSHPFIGYLALFPTSATPSASAMRGRAPHRLCYLQAQRSKFIITVMVSLCSPSFCIAHLVHRSFNFRLSLQLPRLRSRLNRSPAIYRLGYAERERDEGRALYRVSFASFLSLRIKYLSKDVSVRLRSSPKIVSIDSVVSDTTHRVF